jgi:hypothetical protein
VPDQPSDDHSDDTQRPTHELLEELARLFFQSHTHHVRSPERRRGERREVGGLFGLQGRRREDHEFASAGKALLLQYLKTLPIEGLWWWVDWMWLRRLSMGELRILLKAASDIGEPRAPARRSGRPNATPSDQEIQWLWNQLHPAFTEFAAARRRHHAVSNHTARGGFASLDHRRGCLASPLGQAVERAGLFVKFFDDDPHLTPKEMAAWLLHRLYQQQLETREQDIRQKDGGVTRNEALRPEQQQRLNRIQRERRAIGRWRTWYDRLRLGRRRPV